MHDNMGFDLSLFLKAKFKMQGFKRGSFEDQIVGIATISRFLSTEIYKGV